jgi:hypothetical protein
MASLSIESITWFIENAKDKVKHPMTVNQKLDWYRLLARYQQHLIEALEREAQQLELRIAAEDYAAWEAGEIDDDGNEIE